MSTTVTLTSAFAENTAINNHHGALQTTPPLLPAFLITGLLLAAIVFVIVWRHLIERRNARLREADDPTWPEGATTYSGRANGPPPKMWDLSLTRENARATWSEIMPVSAAPLRAKPKLPRPRYLVPSDRRVSLLARMFGGDYRPPSMTLPPISAVPSTQPPTPVSPSDDVDDEEPIDRIQVAVLISLPHPRRVRRSSYYPAEKVRESTDTSLPLESGDDKEAVGPESEEVDPSSSDKGKNSETPTYLYGPNGFYETEHVAGLLQVALGTVILPFDGDEDECEHRKSDDEFPVV